MRRTLLLAAALAASYGCTGGLSCGSSSGCANNYSFPQTQAQVPNGDAFVDNGVRLRMTQNALDFIVANIQPLLQSAFSPDPNNPGVLVINDRVEHDLGSNISINSSINHSGNETRPLSLFIDGNAIASSLQLEFVGVQPGTPDGIHFVVSGIPIGIDARVFADASFFGGTFSGSAACDVSGNNGNLGGFPWFTTVSIDATITPSVGTGSQCLSGTGECMLVSVTVNSAQLGSFGGGDLSVDTPPVCPNTGCDFGVSCHDGTPDGDGPCSEDCSDPVAVVDTGGDAECVATCGLGQFVADIATGLGGVIEPLLNDLLPGLLQTVIQNALANFNGKPIAASGRLSLASFAPGVLPDDALDLGFAVGPTTGAFDVNAPDPTVGAQGMDLIMKTGFEAAPSLVDDTPVPNPCVRAIQGNDFANLYGGFDFTAPDAQPLTGVFNGQVYALGASLAAAGLNQAAFAAYNSGALCIEMSSDSIHKLTKGGFPLSAGTLDLLTNGELRQFTDDGAPAIIALAPSQPPVISYGEGTDTDGHIHVTWTGVDINFYVLMNERFARVFDVSADISLQLTVFNDPGTGTLKIAVVDGPNVGNFHQKYDELLPGVAFGDLLNTLVSTALDGVLGNGLSFNFDVGPILSNSLGGAPIFVNFVGIETVPPNDRQFLNVYLGLTNTQTQPQIARTRQLHLASDPGVLRTPEVESTSLRALPTGEVKLETDDAFENHEYFARADFGLWRGPIRPSPDGSVVVRDPKLKLVGEHTITLRARTIGDPNSLEPEDEAQSVSVWVDPEPPKVELKQVGKDIVAHGWDIGATEEQLRWQWQLDDGAWSESTTTSVRSIAELTEHGAEHVAVRALDPAGNVSKAAGLDLEIARRRVDDEDKRTSTFGCAQVGVDGVWLGALALGLTALVRRRRP